MLSSNGPDSPPFGFARLAEYRALIFVVLAVALCTVWKFDNTFVWDDIYLIVESDTIHDPSNIPKFFAHHTLYASSGDRSDMTPSVDTYRPITLATFALDSLLSGRRPWAYHLTNFACHLFCVVLIFFFSRSVLENRYRNLAWLPAAWVGLSPQLAEAHVWINGRSDILCTLFGLGSFLFWREAASSSRKEAVLYSIVSGLVFLVGLLCKEVLIMVTPLFVFVPAAFFKHSVPSYRRRAMLLTPVAVASLLYLVLRYHALSGLRTHGHSSQLLAAAARLPVLLADGARELLVPAQLYVRSMRDDYIDWGWTGLIISALCILAATAGSMFCSRRLPQVAWGLAWFALSLAPAALIATLLWLGFGRYLYLPAVGIAISVTTLYGRARQALDMRPFAARAIHIGIILWLGVHGVLLVKQCVIYRDEVTLYTEVMESAPWRAHGYGWLGFTYAEQHRDAEAAALLREADQRAPHDARYLTELGKILMRLGRHREALDVAATGIGRYGEQAATFHHLAALLLQHVNSKLAAQHIRQCLQLEPASKDCQQTVRWLTRQHPRAGEYRHLLSEGPHELQDQ